MITYAWSADYCSVQQALRSSAISALSHCSTSCRSSADCRTFSTCAHVRWIRHVPCALRCSHVIRMSDGQGRNTHQVSLRSRYKPALLHACRHTCEGRCTSNAEGRSFGFLAQQSSIRAWRVGGQCTGMGIREPSNTCNQGPSQSFGQSFASSHTVDQSPRTFISRHSNKTSEAVPFT